MSGTMHSSSLHTVGRPSRVSGAEVLVNIGLLLVGILTYRQLATPACSGLPHSLPPDSTFLAGYPCDGGVVESVLYIFLNIPRALWDLVRVRQGDGWHLHCMACLFFRFAAVLLLPPRWYYQFAAPATMFYMRLSVPIFYLAKGPHFRLSEAAPRFFRDFFVFDLVFYHLMRGAWPLGQASELGFCCFLSACMWTLNRWHGHLVSGRTGMPLGIAARLLVPIVGVFLEHNRARRRGRGPQTPGSPSGSMARAQGSRTRKRADEAAGDGKAVGAGDVGQGEPAKGSGAGRKRPGNAPGVCVVGESAEASGGVEDTGALALSWPMQHGGKSCSPNPILAAAQPGTGGGGSGRGSRDSRARPGSAGSGGSGATDGNTLVGCGQDCGHDEVSAGVVGHSSGELQALTLTAETAATKSAPAGAPGAPSRGPLAGASFAGPAAGTGSSAVGSDLPAPAGPARVVPPPYRPYIRKRTVFVKIPWAEPEDLQPDFRERLRELVEGGQRGPADGSASGPPSWQLGHVYVRRGCVELMVVLEWPEDDSAAVPAAPFGRSLDTGALLEALGLRPPEGEGEAAQSVAPAALSPPTAPEADGAAGSCEHAQAARTPGMHPSGSLYGIRVWELEEGRWVAASEAADTDAEGEGGPAASSPRGCPAPRLLSACPRVLLLPSPTEGAGAAGDAGASPAVVNVAPTVTASPDQPILGCCEQLGGSCPGTARQGQREGRIARGSEPSVPDTRCPAVAPTSCPAAVLRVEVAWGGHRGGTGSPHGPVSEPVGPGPRSSSVFPEAAAAAEAVVVAVRSCGVYLSARVAACSAGRWGERGGDSGNEGCGGAGGGGNKGSIPVSSYVYDIELLQLLPSPGVVLVELYLAPTGPPRNTNPSRWDPVRVLVPLLATHDPGVAGELEQAVASALPGRGDEMDGLLYDMGTWLGAAAAALAAAAGGTGSASGGGPRAGPTAPPYLRRLGRHLLCFARAAGWGRTEEVLRRGGAAGGEEQERDGEEQPSWPGPVSLPVEVSPRQASSTSTAPSFASGASTPGSCSTCHVPTTTYPNSTSCSTYSNSNGSVATTKSGIVGDHEGQGTGAISDCCCAAGGAAPAGAPSDAGPCRPAGAPPECPRCAVLPSRGVLPGSPEEFTVRMAGTIQAVDTALLAVFLLRNHMAGLPLFGVGTLVSVLVAGWGAACALARLLLPHTAWARMTVAVRLPRYCGIMVGKTLVAGVLPERFPGVSSPNHAVGRLLYEGVVLPGSCLLDWRTAALVSSAKLLVNAALVVACGATPSWLGAVLQAARVEVLALATTAACHAYLRRVRRRAAVGR